MKEENKEYCPSEIDSVVSQADQVVFVAGNFNIVHPGHLRLLRFAAESGDFLIVGIYGDSNSGVTVPQEMRLEGIQAISLVDYAFIMREPLEVTISKIKPAVVVKGKEFENRANIEQKSIEAYGGKLLFSSGEVTFSSLDLLHREYYEVSHIAASKLPYQSKRFKFTAKELRESLQKVEGLKVLVIGDLIVDEYIICEPLGLSQEDPTIVVTPIETKRFIGGAGIVAAHASGLGGTVQYLSVAGDDGAAVFAEEKLSKYGVGFQIFRDDSRPTTLKKRYRAGGKSLLRVSELRQHAISKDIASKLISAARRAMMDCDIVIFSDFNYGCLPQELINELISFGEKMELKMVADSQASSQLSDISRFKGMSILTPTELEARLAIRDTGCGLAVLAESLANKAQADNIIITLGAEGLLIITKDDNSGEWITDILPAFNDSPRDVVGAGDSLLTCTSMMLSAGNDIWLSAYLGSIAAGCQVSRIGNTPLTQQDLYKEIEYF